MSLWKGDLLVVCVRVCVCVCGCGGGGCESISHVYLYCGHTHICDERGDRSRRLCPCGKVIC